MLLLDVVEVMISVTGVIVGMKQQQEVNNHLSYLRVFDIKDSIIPTAVLSHRHYVDLY